MFTYFLFVLGFVLLLKGAAWLVEGASSLAKKFGISSLVIGLTIVAFGTSAPELIVNTFASIGGNTGLAVGNILGSNIANILLIGGIASIIYPLTVQKGTVWKEIPFSLLAVLMLAAMVNDAFIDQAEVSRLGRIDGLVLLGFMVIFFAYALAISKQSREGEHARIKEYALLPSWFMVLLGVGGLTLGGKWIVDGAILIASSLGVSEALVGLTIVAVGTSLPELATSAVAAFKKHSDIAIGNIVGSNIYNIFFILGISAVIKPLVFSVELNQDIFVVLLATVLLFMAMFVDQHRTLQRWQGAMFLVIYIAYLSYIIFRG